MENLGWVWESRNILSWGAEVENGVRAFYSNTLAKVNYISQITITVLQVCC